MNADRTDEEVGFQSGYDHASYGVSRQELDAMGERTVRDYLNSGKYGHAGLAPFAFVSAWLADAAFSRELEASAKRDAREEETLSIAKRALAISEEANSIARSQTKAAWRASRYAMYAAIIATTAAIVASKDEIFALVISWLP